MRVPRRFDKSDKASIVQVRRMRIARPVRLLMVPAVDRAPVNHRPLKRHRSKDSQKKPDNRSGFKRTMREKPVIADRDSENRQRVHGQQERQFKPTNSAAPQKYNAEDKPDKRERDAGKYGPTF